MKIPLHPVTNIQKEKAKTILNYYKENNTTYENHEQPTLLGSNYTDSIFVKTTKITTDGDNIHTKTVYTEIQINGQMNYDLLNTMEFKTLADKVHFFNTLFPITYE